MINVYKFAVINFSLVVLLGCSQPAKLPTEHRINIPTNISLAEKSLLIDFEILSSDLMQGRATGSEGNILAQNHIVNTLKSWGVNGYKGTYIHPFYIKSKGIYGHNIVANVDGEDPTLPPIVISAHYDHLGLKGVSKIYNGADDNASGTAVALYFAKLLANSPLRHSVLFLFSDAEELNLLGARAFLKENPKLTSSIRLNINLDMLAGSQSLDKLYYIARGISSLMTDDEYGAFRKLAKNRTSENYLWI